jgi:pyruvate/2-oxoglutarate/acetoin dehydrogenase E1 component
MMVHRALWAVEKLAGEEISIEIVDPRLDTDKTGMLG